MRRFVVPQGSISGDRITICGAEAHHIAVVLRMRPGERVVVLDGSQTERVVELSRVTPEEVTGHIVETRPGLRSGIHLTLVQGVPKGAKMDDVIRMGTELGVAEFAPVAARRSVAEGRQRTGRWRKIAVAATKQSRRSDVPVVHDPAPLSSALEMVSGYDLVLILWEEERLRTIADALIRSPAPQRVAVIVGPEGGLEAAELEEAVRRGAVPVSLGPLVLRTETAGVAAVAMVLYELTLRRQG